MKRFGPCLFLVVVTLGAGCAVPPTPPTPVAPRREVNPVSGKGYWIYVPSTYRHSEPMPLIVSCHGTPPYDVSEHHIREWKWYAEKNGCIVVAPELVGTDGILGDGPLSGMLSNEQHILSLISTLSFRYNLDLANVMITGFSGGGFPTYFVGLRHPDVFSVVVARNCNFSRGNLDGWYPEQAKQTPILVYYGSADPAAIQSQSAAAVQYLRENGFHVKSEVIPGVGHERHPEVAMEFFREHWQTPQPTIPGP